MRYVPLAGPPVVAATLEQCLCNEFGNSFPYCCFSCLSCLSCFRWFSIACIYWFYIAENHGPLTDLNVNIYTLYGKLLTVKCMRMPLANILISSTAIKYKLFIKILCSCCRSTRSGIGLGALRGTWAFAHRCQVLRGGLPGEGYAICASEYAASQGSEGQGTETEGGAQSSWGEHQFDATARGGKWYKKIKWAGSISGCGSGVKLTCLLPMPLIASSWLNSLFRWPNNKFILLFLLFLCI